LDPIRLDLTALRAAYDGSETPASVLDRVYTRIEGAKLNPVWRTTWMWLAW